MRYFLPSLILSLVFTLIATLMKILHWAGAPFVLDLAFVFILVYIALGLKDTWGETKMRTGSKIWWSIGIVFFGWIFGFIYYKRVYLPRIGK
ncbi:hypothetical protein [Robertkochia sediminum]|uniref:hypothetical protein n=1 Tax=Robertkochia sediminum TaxID=2785326 RepID=UPI001932479B|nr:hypothetical protein [Robertkochia sediminum]MBL7473200.1 hypothetical protein [Robertkochia sediminum]